MSIVQIVIVSVCFAGLSIAVAVVQSRRMFERLDAVVGESARARVDLAATRTELRAYIANIGSDLNTLAERVVSPTKGTPAPSPPVRHRRRRSDTSGSPATACRFGGRVAGVMRERRRSAAVG